MNNDDLSNIDDDLTPEEAKDIINDRKYIPFKEYKMSEDDLFNKGYSTGAYEVLLRLRDKVNSIQSRFNQGSEKHFGFYAAIGKVLKLIIDEAHKFLDIK